MRTKRTKKILSKNRSCLENQKTERMIYMYLETTKFRELVDVVDSKMDEVFDVVDSKMDEVFDTVTYLLEDFVEGEYYDKDGNVTKEFAELKEIAVRLIQLKAKKW